jgi:hypothetical protein
MYKSIISKDEKNQLIQDLKIKGYFLFDSYNALAKCKITNIYDSDGIFIKYYNENEQIIIEDIFKIENFINSYDFIYIKTENENARIIGLLLPKNNL